VAATVSRPSSHEVVFTRLLDAPRDIVFQAWSDPRHLHRWWGPYGFTITTHEFSFVPGGVWRFTMLSPSTEPNPTRVVFREIDPPSRLVLENSWGLPDAPLAFTLVASFEPVGTKTRLSMRLSFRDAAAMKIAVERYGVIEGGVQTLERMAAAVAIAD
jgi:uncharacterized protein YndB with AHSA1/START domain